jgi:esterase/lipase superfamily enzyme
MLREIHNWYSPSLNKDMELAVYGHYGTAILLFPTAAADHLEYERFKLIEAVKPLIDDGRVKLFSIGSVNNESWLNDSMYPPHKSIKHGQYNQYVMEEVFPFIFDNCKNRVPIITAGASFGALHAANTFFRCPDIVRGTIAMSGVYDLKYYTGGYYDDNVYYNSPIDYLPDLNDENRLNLMRDNLGVVIASGQGDYEDPSSSKYLSEILNSKGIKHWLDLWGHDIKHEWSTWLQMLPYFLNELTKKN